jgi:hypothetical protein
VGVNAVFIETIRIFLNYFVNTFKPAEETYVDERKDGKAKIHEDG